VYSGASVKATQCEFSENGGNGVDLDEGSKGIFTDCSIQNNGAHGVCAYGVGALVKLCGEQTEIHHNEFGLFVFSNATINIYIPSRSITALVHDNEDGSDLATLSGGKIQSQLSSSSLELTVIQEAPPDSDDEDEEEY